MRAPGGGRAAVPVEGDPPLAERQLALELLRPAPPQVAHVEEPEVAGLEPEHGQISPGPTGLWVIGGPNLQNGLASAADDITFAGRGDTFAGFDTDRAAKFIVLAAKECGGFYMRTPRPKAAA